MIISLSEIQKFIRNNIKIILIGAVLLSVIFMYVFSKNEPELESNIDKVNEGMDFETDAKPANFLFYIENEDGSIFTNHLLIEQYFLTKDSLEKSSEEIDVDLSKFVIEAENRIGVNYTPSGKASIIGVGRNESTHVIELAVNIGNRKKNMLLANYYHELLTKNEVPFLADKSLYIFREPQIKEVEPIENLESIDLPATNKGIVVKDILFSIILGTATSMMIILGLNLLSEKIRYSFTYPIKKMDSFILLDYKRTNIEEFRVLLQSITDNSYIVSENDLGSNSKYDSLFTEDLNNLIRENNINSILEITSNKEIDKLIYIIEENTTTRKWYNRQRDLEKNYDIPKYIVQINKK